MESILTAFWGDRFITLSETAQYNFTAALLCRNSVNGFNKAGSDEINIQIRYDISGVGNPAGVV